MESKSKTWHQPWTFALTCKIREPGAETRYRVSLAAIHVQYDDFFETVRPSSRNERTFSQWQYISGLVNQRARERTQPSEGAEDLFDTSPSIPINESHPEEANLELQVDTDKFSPVDDDIDTQDSQNLPEETQEGPLQEQPAEMSGTPNVSQYGWVCRPTQRMIESREQGNVAFQAYYDAMHQDDYLLQDQMQNPIAFMASTNQDTMYFHQAMQAPDRDQFKKAVVKEVNDHIENHNWELFPREHVHGVDGRSKRTLHCGDYFHCVGSDFLGSIDSGFWLVAVVTWYCPDDGFLAFSWLLAARVFHSTQEDH
jgi:hypothetical protein